MTMAPPAGFRALRPLAEKSFSSLKPVGRAGGPAGKRAKAMAPNQNIATGGPGRHRLGGGKHSTGLFAKSAFGVDHDVEKGFKDSVLRAGVKGAEKVNERGLGLERKMEGRGKLMSRAAGLPRAASKGASRAEMKLRGARY